jgi:regulator of chromosome condensation
VTEAGKLYMWGQGDEGQLGLGPNMKQSASPFIMTSMLKEHIVHIACARAHTMAITKTGKLYT